MRKREPAFVWYSLIVPSPAWQRRGLLMACELLGEVLQECDLLLELLRGLVATTRAPLARLRLDALQLLASVLKRLPQVLIEPTMNTSGDLVERLF
jgi:hypothetical protein